ncbi:MAG: hypothetical protein R3F19_28115 [Verrucomicrobiales bacterium]
MAESVSETTQLRSQSSPHGMVEMAVLEDAAVRDGVQRFQASFRPVDSGDSEGAV